MTEVEQKALDWVYRNGKLSKDTVDGFITAYREISFSSISDILNDLDMYFDKVYTNFSSRIKPPIASITAISAVPPDAEMAQCELVLRKMDQMKGAIRMLKEQAKELHI